MMNPFDYDADSRTRIWRLLEINNVAWPDRFKQSVDTAGAQLEYAKSDLMGGIARNGRLVAGPAVMIIFAHHEKVLTFDMRPTAGLTIIEGVANAIDYARGDEMWSGGMLAQAIEDWIEKYGRTPGLHGAVELDSEHNIGFIGNLFLYLPDGCRADIVDKLEKLIAVGVCPALIGLLGKGTQKRMGLVWPLPLAVAPYAGEAPHRDKMN
jgi:hypothetical protein